MKWLLIFVILLACSDAAQTDEESLGTRIKRVLEPDPSPTPSRKHRKHSTKEPTPTPSPAASSKRKKASPTPTPTATPKSKSKRKKASPTPTPEAEESPSATPLETPLSSTSERAPGKKGWPNVSLSPDEIEGYKNYSPKVRQIIDAGLALTKQNLGYTYGSADPKNGGMDCSGFVYYVLQQNGFPDVPRDSSQQYVWVRKAGDFDAVVSRKEDSFEFDDLKPGDLLFWRGTYNIDRDPPITHTMIYLGREKRTNKRVMVGSSDGRTYDGKQRWGVSVFDFKMPPPPKSGDAKISPVFVGYGRIPGLNAD
ncbi:MAG TPA: NlpC/P60 family protein [Candidatus Udaeobacter sp.]|jgi:cell wall-associated NlpC family hydrolase|nr:NlpC/P60 family protein [Candidatus Udaeobacter sp.]